MATKTVQLGTSRNFTGFVGFNNINLTSSYTITTADTNVTGALTGSTTARPVRLSTVQVFFRNGTAGTASVIAGPQVQATSFVGPSTGTSNQSSLTGSPNLPFFAGNEMWSGFRSTNTGTKLFWRGTQSGSNFRYNGTINAAFDSSNGTAINQTLTIHTAPSAPTSISASAGRTSVTLGWGAPTDTGGVAINGYRVAYRASGGAWTFFSTYNAFTTSATVTGLSSSTTYEFAVAATNGVTDAHNGYTDVSAHTGTNATISATTLAPLSPSLGTLTVTAIDQTSIRVQWSTTNDPTSVSVSGPGMTTRNTASGDINATGLTANTTYTYTLTTQNEANAGVPDSTTASARTLLPAPTLTITATTLTSTTARVVWSTTNATAASITGPNLTSTELSGNVIVEGLTRNTVYRWNGNSSNGDGNTGNVLSNQIQTLNVIGGVWTGTTFAVPAVRVWTGSTWAVKEAKVWTGTTWKVWVQLLFSISIFFE